MKSKTSELKLKKLGALGMKQKISFEMIVSIVKNSRIKAVKLYKYGKKSSTESMENRIAATWILNISSFFDNPVNKLRQTSRNSFVFSVSLFFYSLFDSN